MTALIDRFGQRGRRGLRPDITVDDIAIFVRQAVAADGEESRAQAIDILLAGGICPVEHNTVDSGQT